MEMQEKIPLAPLTTLRAGGSARYFFVARTDADIAEAAGFARERVLPLFVLGGGSNVLVSDNGFPGVVIKNEIGGVAYEELGDGRVRVTAGAGVVWDDMVKDTVDRGLYGLENLSLIPGTVGAAPIQNINAYGAHASTTIESVSVFDSKTASMIVLPKSGCEFEYRTSVFKTNKDLIVTRVVFILSRAGVVDCSYKDIEKYFERKQTHSPTLAEMRDAIICIRTGKLPATAIVGTAGSFFVHPIVPKEYADMLKDRFPDLSIVPYANGTAKIIAGRLLDMLGWKGVREGNMGTHKTHALAVVNYGSGNAQEIYDFAERMRKDTKSKTGIQLEYEVNLVGDF